MPGCGQRMPPRARMRAPFRRKCTEASYLSEEAQQDVNRIEAIWREARDRFGGGGPFLFGTFGIADAMFAPVAARFATYSTSLGEEATHYCEALLAHPFMVEWCAAARIEPWMIPAFEVDADGKPQV
jgi:glutathione S-transferase